MGRMLATDLFSHGLRSKCADLLELLRGRCCSLVRRSQAAVVLARTDDWLRTDEGHSLHRAAPVYEHSCEAAESAERGFANGAE